jgi:hypothetical protein
MREINMETTIKYALQEKYVEGYNDARKAIAEQIRQGCSFGPYGTINVCPHCENSADIAKGVYGDL